MLLTHWHPDHTLGLESLLTLCPKAKVYKHTPSDDNFPINDGDVFSVDGATIKAMHTPGHTADHTTFWLEEEGAMFSGDNVLGHGTSVFEDYKTYLASLDKMKTCFRNHGSDSDRETGTKTDATKEGRIYPAHGAVIPDGAAKIQEYIEHRKLRERQILDAMKLRREEDGEQLTTPNQIVKAVYKDTPEHLHGAAKKGVEQILRKMSMERRVVHVGVDSDDEDLWELTLKGRM